MFETDIQTNVKYWLCSQRNCINHKCHNVHNKKEYIVRNNFYSIALFWVYVSLTLYFTSSFPFKNKKNQNKESNGTNLVFLRISSMNNLRNRPKKINRRTIRKKERFYWNKLLLILIRHPLENTFVQEHKAKQHLTKPLSCGIL